MNKFHIVAEGKALHVCYLACSTFTSSLVQLNFTFLLSATFPLRSLTNDHSFRLVWQAREIRSNQPIPALGVGKGSSYTGPEDKWGLLTG